VHVGDPVAAAAWRRRPVRRTNRNDFWTDEQWFHPRQISAISSLPCLRIRVALIPGGGNPCQRISAPRLTPRVRASTPEGDENTVTASVPTMSASPVLDESEATRRTLVLSELQAALAALGVQSVRAARHGLVLHYSASPPLAPSGPTDPTLHVSSRPATASPRPMALSTSSPRWRRSPITGGGSSPARPTASLSGSRRSALPRSSAGSSLSRSRPRPPRRTGLWPESSSPGCC
jgi:hypothetical protein